MDKRLKIITIITGVIFAVIFIDSLVSFTQGFQTGFTEGLEEARSGEVLLVKDIILALFTLFALFLAVLIPVHVFRIIRSITKSIFFEFANVKRLRKVGYSILVIYVIFVAVIIREGDDMLQASLEHLLLFLLGLVVLMFAEVLKISVRLKEEQDLTV